MRKSLNNICHLIFVISSASAILLISGIAHLFVLIAPPLLLLTYGAVLLVPIAVIYGSIKVGIEFGDGNSKKAILYLFFTLVNIFCFLAITGAINIGWMNLSR